MAAGVLQEWIKKITGAQLPLGSAAPHVATRPLWRELAPGQQQALAPLATDWDTLNEAQKRKWIALSAATRSVIALALGLLGVSAPESM